MKKKTFLNFLSILLILPFLWTPSSLAGEGLDGVVDRLTFRDARADLQKQRGLFVNPFLKTGFDYSSNVFKSSAEVPSAGVHGAGVWTISPGLDLVHVGDYGRAGVSYQADFKYVSDFGNANSQDQDFLVFANLKPTDSTYFNISDRLIQKGAMPGSPDTETINYLDNRVITKMGLHLDSGQTLEFGYQNYEHRFQETVASRYSYNENIYDWRIYQKTGDRQRVYTGFRLGDVDFDSLSSRDTTYVEFPVGIEGDLLWGWTGSASVGLHHRNLHASSRNDITRVVTNVGVQRSFLWFESLHFHEGHTKLMPTTFEFGFLRRPQEGTFSTATTFDDKLMYGNLKHLVTPKLRGRMSMYAGKQDYEGRVFTGSRVLVGNALFVTTPDQVRRTDRVFGIGTGLDYNLSEHMKLHFDYQISRRASNVVGLDYTDHTVSVRTTIPL